MLEISIWTFGVAIAVSAMLITVAMEFYSLQFALGAVIATFISISALRDHREATSIDNPNLSHLSAIIVRHMGILWAWAAVSICAIYGMLMVWTETWVPLFILLVLGAGTCLFVANILERDAQAGKTDDKVINFVGQIAKIQFVLTCLLIGGLLAAGKLGASTFSEENKWPAVNILLCTAIGLAVVSGFTLIASKTQNPSRQRQTAPVVSSPAPQPRRRRPVARIV